MVEARRELYALAGALSVTTGELLRQVHTAAGPPGAEGREGASPDRDLAVAAVRAHSAAAACSALAARLLIGEADLARRRLGEIGSPDIIAAGVTVLEGPQPAVWRGSVRATAAAAAELLAATKAWAQVDGPTAGGVGASLEALMRYVERLAAVLEQNEPSAPEELQRVTFGDAADGG